MANGFDAITPEMDAVFAAVACERQAQEAAFEGGGMFDHVGHNPDLYATSVVHAVRDVVVALREQDRDAVYTASVRAASVLTGLAEATLPAGASAATPSVPAEYPEAA